MALLRDVYQALEDIVGPDNISDDPAILDSYSSNFGSELMRDDVDEKGFGENFGSKFHHRAEAVVMPVSTEEVQAIVKACNRYKIKFHALSNGWTPQAFAWEGTIQLDMRRMNRILELDPKNMFAVVEPYVICNQLQAEAMRVGLNVHMIGAGGSCSVLACHTWGWPGPPTLFMGSGPENLLGLEWVTPTGDIVRTGSMAMGVGWFSSEGPGPSLRGIPRQAGGGLGVFTKASIKLHPWPGPSTMPIQGTVPAYESPVPSNFRVYTLAFPDWQAYSNAYYKIYDNEIGYIGHRQYIKWGDELQAGILKIVTDPTKQLCDLEDLLKTPEVQKMNREMRIAFQLVLAGMTPKDIEFQDEVLNEILKETKGWKVAEMSTPHMDNWSLLYLVKLCYKSMNWIEAGGWNDLFSTAGTPDAMFASGLNDQARDLLKNPPAGIVAHGGDSAMGGLNGLGGDAGLCGLEPFVYYDPHDRESCKDMARMQEAGAKFLKDRGFPPTNASFAVGLRPSSRNALISSFPVAFRWQRRIKEVLDPNNVGDRCYMTAEEEKK
jgi:glycolate oxidase